MTPKNNALASLGALIKAKKREEAAGKTKSGNALADKLGGMFRKAMGTTETTANGDTLNTVASSQQTLPKLNPMALAFSKKLGL